MNKMMLTGLLILGLTAGCAGTGSDKGKDADQGEKIPLEQIESGEM